MIGILRNVLAVQRLGIAPSLSFGLSASVRGSNIMDKYIGKQTGKKKRRKWHVSPPSSDIRKILALGSKENRRLSPAGLKLNKKFDSILRERLASHENHLISSVSVLEVKLQPSLSNIEIVWLGSGDVKHDEATQAALNSIRTELRGSLILASGGRRPSVGFVRDLRPFYVRQVGELLDNCCPGRGDLSASDAAKVEAAEKEAVERRLEVLYPYHEKMREKKARREARWAEKTQQEARLSKFPRARPGDVPKMPSGQEEDEDDDEAYGVPYARLRQLVLSAVAKTDTEVEKAEVAETAARPVLTESEVRRLTLEARGRALHEMAALRRVWRKERKRRNFRSEEEEEEEEAEKPY